MEYIQLDLMDKPAVQKKLRRQHVNDVTYVFHLAFHGELPGSACKLNMLYCLAMSDTWYTRRGQHCKPRSL